MFTHFAFVGCRTTRERNARGLGISTFGVSPDGTWTPLDVTQTAANPSFLACDAAGETLYAVHGDGTELSCLRIDDAGALSVLARLTTAGLNPVDLVLDPSGRFVVVTNHLSDGLVVCRRQPDGRLGEIVGYAAAIGTLGPHRSEQTRVKPHQARFLPGGRLLAVPNKGADTVSVYELDLATGALCERPECTAKLREGAGPRNLALHPTLPILYVVCELDSTVCTVAFEDDGRLTAIQVASSRSGNGFGLSRAAAIVVEPDGGRLHVTNRGEDCVATFALTADGELGASSFRPTMGRTPRFACMDLDDTSLLVANEDTDTIVRLPSGGSAAVVAQTPSPVSIAFAACRPAIVPIVPSRTSEPGRAGTRA